ncbi:hypothetical protein TorRG33x02_243210 [Trema orientale]|uniref:Uncharacterized protein n=1 Tax=Trema orientale TaxID=63057 RepID=A0A2P5DS71_TREOI|nr:hypothetical protein TorRG33x02_243210 [Trema orientale]
MGAPGPSGFGGVFGNCRGFVRGRFAGSLSSGDAHVAEIVDEGNQVADQLAAF